MSSQQPEHHDIRHPTFKQYVLIATILFVITGIEFAIIVPQHLRGHAISIPPLIILSALKFAIVVMFYMHLRFDSRTFTTVFLGGLVLAFIVGSALLGVFGAFQPTPRYFAEANAVPYAGGEEGSPEIPGESTQQSPGSSEAPAAAPTAEPSSGGADLVAEGKTLAQTASPAPCTTCHSTDGTVIVGPSWKGLYGEEVHMADGSTVVADDAYIHESIVDPNAKIVEGFQPNVMIQTYKDTLSDSDIEAITAYIKSLK